MEERLGLSSHTTVGTSKDKPVRTENPQTLKEYEDNIALLKEEKQTATGDRVAEINRELKKYQDAVDEP